MREHLVNKAYCYMIYLKYNVNIRYATLQTKVYRPKNFLCGNSVGYRHPFHFMII